MSVSDRADEDLTAPIVIAVISYRRLEGLKRLLRSLARLEVHSLPPVAIVVVDNDSAQSARPLVQAEAKRAPLPLHYATEARRGIPTARNRSVAVAQQLGASWVAFLDDDTTADRDWLAELWRVRGAHDADVVAGPQLPELAIDAPRWLAPFYEVTRHATGSVIDRAYTHNALVRAPLLGNAPFDEAMALTGGSDSHLFRRLHRDGARLVWADAAHTRERVPASRTRVGWVLQRGFRFGCSFAYIERDLFGFRRALQTVLAAGFYRIAKGVVTLPTVIAGRRRGVTALRHICYGAGMLLGWTGLRYREYRQVHGR